MAHYAKVVNGIVEKVIVADASFFDSFVDDTPGQWIQTSYNTRGGIYYTPNNWDRDVTRVVDEDQSKAFRANFAGIGGHYDQEKDIFVTFKSKYICKFIYNTCCRT